MPVQKATAKIADKPETSYSQPVPRIVCAALRHRQHATRIIASVHHGDRVMVNQIQPMENPGDFEPGFLDSKGRFLTRAEAAGVAMAAGQVPAGNTLLLSEELY